MVTRNPLFAAERDRLRARRASASKG
jgi:hypothetical protein